MHFGKVKRHQSIKQVFNLLFVSFLALSPLAEFHNHEEVHACVRIGSDNFHLEFADRIAALSLDQDQQFTPTHVGSPHHHKHCALCWFSSAMFFSPATGFFQRSTAGGRYLYQNRSLPSRFRISKYQRGPPEHGDRT